MGRAEYSEDCDGSEVFLYRRSVETALRGRRGQRLVRDLIAGLEAMEDRRLITEDLVDDEGCVCALGAVARIRNIDDTLLKVLNDQSPSLVARVLDIAESLAREVMFENDDDFGIHIETPEQRWERVYAWAQAHLLPEGA